MDLDCANNLGMLVQSLAESQAMIKDLADKVILAGLQTSLPKTKAIQTAGMDETPVTLNSSQIEDFQSLKYLRSVVSLLANLQKRSRAAHCQPQTSSFNLRKLSRSDITFSINKAQRQ